VSGFDLGEATFKVAKATPGPITPQIERKLYDETDARFVAKTGITHKLDPKNAADAKLIPSWVTLYGEVKKQFLAGTLAWTHDHPAVAQSVEAARAAGRAFADALSGPDPAHVAATGAPLPVTPQAHAAHAASAAHAHDAATAQAAIDGAAGAVTPHSSGFVAGLRQGAQAIMGAVQSAGDAAAALQAQDAPAAAIAAPAAGTSSAAAAASEVPLAERGKRAKWLTPPVALGIVAGALGLGALITNAASSPAPRRRGRR
jgi:hypothetical protein